MMGTKRYKRHKELEPKRSPFVPLCGGKSLWSVFLLALFLHVAHALPSQKPADDIPPLVLPTPVDDSEIRDVPETVEPETVEEQGEAVQSAPGQSAPVPSANEGSRP